MAKGLPEMENICHLYACVHLTVAHKIAKFHAVFHNSENNLERAITCNSVKPRKWIRLITTAPFPPAQLTNQGHAEFLPLKDNQ